MNCEIIEGKFGGKLLYVPSEKMLYAKKCTRGNDETEIFECYQATLTDKGKKDNSDHVPCTSRVRLRPDGTCERVNSHIPHTEHDDHQLIAADKKKMINMKNICRNLKENHPENSSRIPNKHIFQREISK